MSAKYPRSPHLPWSPGCTNDDRVMSNVTGLIGIPIVVTEKLDGGNQCFTRQEVYARSHSARPSGEAYDFIKAIHARVRHLIDPSVSVFGENVYAVHTIRYDRLPGYFLTFAVRQDDTNQWWAWEDVQLLSATLDLPPVPVLFAGAVGTVAELQGLTTKLVDQPSCFGPQREGVVVRVAQAFANRDFEHVLAKSVRADHVAGQHWTRRRVERQRLG